MSGWPEVLPASPSPSQHRGMSLSPACHPTSLKPHGSDSWDSRAPRKPSSTRESQGPEVLLPATEPHLGAPGSAAHVTPQRGRKTTAWLLPLEPGCPRCVYATVLGRPAGHHRSYSGLPAGLTDGTDEGRKEEK